MPMASDLSLCVATIRPPLVATASAEALSDQSAAPLGLNKSCQNVFNGWPTCPIATVAQEPAEVSIEVAREARITAPLTCAIGPATGVVPQPETADAPSAASPSAAARRRHGGRGRARREQGPVLIKIRARL
jgi:hypothetical protein